MPPSTADRSPPRIQPLDAARGYVRWTQTCPPRPQLKSISASPSHTEIKAAGPVLNLKSFILDYFFGFPSPPRCVFKVFSPTSKAQTQLDTRSLHPPQRGRAPQTHFTSGSPADPGVSRLPRAELMLKAPRQAAFSGSAVLENAAREKINSPEPQKKTQTCNFFLAAWKGLGLGFPKG